MALGDTYASLDEFKRYMALTETSQHDNTLEDALQSASKEIERLCNRQFNNSEAAPTARVYKPTTWTTALVDDFLTTTGLIIKTDVTGDGTFETTWTTSDYELFPLNGIVEGQGEWPYYKIVSVLGERFPINRTGRKATVEVTAKWGWASVPAPIKQACLLMAAETFQLKDAPLGVAGMGEFGVVRVRGNKMAANKLQPFIREPVLVA